MDNARALSTPTVDSSMGTNVASLARALVDHPDARERVLVLPHSIANFWERDMGAPRIVGSLGDGGCPSAIWCAKLEKNGSTALA
jgi:hypothetical protein